MSKRSEILALLGETRASRVVLKRIRAFYDERFADEVRMGPTADNAIVLSEVLGNFYICAETIFLRISQHFENSLSQSAWHKDLLGKMRIEIPGIRPAVISEATFGNLSEILRFRHFRRYYLEFEYDWAKLRIVEDAYSVVRDRFDEELDRFEAYLGAVAEELGDSPS